MNCPYRFIYPQYPVKVIRHDNRRVQFDLWVSTRKGFPDLPNGFSCGSKTYIAFGDYSEERFSLAGHQRHKICSRLGIVVFWQSDRPAVMG